jgi:thiol-disulfide isomerase/thioredoxin
VLKKTCQKWQVFLFEIYNKAKGGNIVMKEMIIKAMASLIVVALLYGQGICAEPPAVGGALPDFTLSAPKDSGEKSYLGLSWWGGKFTIPKIKADVVIIEIYSMYCPYCQAEAPKVNALYERIEADPALKGKIKLIGIGVGNSSYEVNVFRNRYNVTFPLFPDGDFTIHKLIGEVRTPYFIGVKINKNGSHQVFYSKLGAFESVDQFLTQMIRLSGLR